MADIALTRELSPAIERCELTHLARLPIDLDKARAQHREYERVLEGLGCHVERLPAGDDLPDSVFIEDIALVFDEIAIISRPGGFVQTRRSPCSGVRRRPISALPTHRVARHPRRRRRAHRRPVRVASFQLRRRDEGGPRWRIC